jgi:hypothetical protein
MLLFDLLAVPGAFRASAVETDSDLLVMLFNVFMLRRFTLLRSELYDAFGVKIS